MIRVFLPTYLRYVIHCGGELSFDEDEGCTERRRSLKMQSPPFHRRRAV